MIIFDWDGTLCDSVSQIVTSIQSAASELGVDVPSDEAAAKIIGLGLPQAVAVLFPDAPETLLEDIARVYSRHYVNSEQGPPRLFPGALETLQALKDRGLEIAVATGKSRRGLDRVLGVLGLEEFFHASRCADETRSKPDPLMLVEIMRERGVAPSEVVMIGDTEYDLAMAARAGVPSVGVSYGVHSPERLSGHAPVAIVDSLPELLDLPALAARRG